MARKIARTLNSSKGNGLVDLLRLIGVSIGTGVVASPILQVFNSYIQQPVWGVPVTTIGAALTGAVLSLFFGDPVTSRRLLFGQVLASTLFGAGFAVLVADGMGWEWAQKSLSMFAMINAAMIRWFLPAVIERGKLFIKDFKFSFTKQK